jgi:hypothetical protein
MSCLVEYLEFEVRGWWLVQDRENLRVQTSKEYYKYIYVFLLSMTLLEFKSGFKTYLFTT